MEIKPIIKQYRVFIFILISSFLIASCSGGDNGGAPADTTAPDATTNTTVSVAFNGLLTVSGKAEANSTVIITFPDGSQKTTTADANGDYHVVSTLPQATGDISIVSKDAAGNASPATVEAYVDNTAPLPPTSTLSSKASDGTLIISGMAEPGATVTVTFADDSQQDVTADNRGYFTAQSAQVQASNQATLICKDVQGNVSPPVRTDMIAPLAYKPSIGINTEQPQGGADNVAVPMPFVDIFRTARPFKEFSGNVVLDDNGWVTTTDTAAGKYYAKTKLLQGSLNHSIPSGTYTIFYEGAGYLEFGGGGPVSNHQKLVGDHQDTVELTLKDAITGETNAINLNIKGISAGDGNYLKNIRIVMPGGTCAGNPFIRVDSQMDCPNNASFESFAERLKNDRNAIIFNPDYLLFLRQYKVIRMMNMMEASLKHTCASEATCPASLGTWADRASMDDAIWGGSDDPLRTPYAEHKGVAIEAVVALANTLKRDMWINIPHFAKDDYVSHFAQYVFDHLDPSLRVYIEYSNEVWNAGFAGHDYITAKGVAEGLNTVPANFIGTNRDDPNYFARLRYFSKRSVEIFSIWQSTFGTNADRLERVLGSFIGDKILTEQMIKYVSDELGQDKIDAIAIAPYFYGCIDRATNNCPNAITTFLEATTVDDIFTVINETAANDIKSLDGIIKTIKDFQIQPIKDYNANHVNKIKLFTYEGGQHLVVNAVPAGNRDSIRPLFNLANRDARMKTAYLKLLNEWKALSADGAGLFTLYTVPRTNSDYGDFGLKDHLNKTRAESPKFDATITFQETQGQCWWDSCNP